MKDRKSDHIHLAFEARTGKDEIDQRFMYEPILSAHPENPLKEFDFFGKKLKSPIWVSSMTGGTNSAGAINKNLARVCKEFGLGMGLGSCRPLLDDKKHLKDFDLRDIIGEEAPFFANLGIAQIEKLIERNEIGRIDEMIADLRADGLIIHVNPVQEWLQPEGDLIRIKPIDTIARLLERSKMKIIVKEVGQGMGYESLKALLELPLEAIEFGAFGGTNFAKLELMRSDYGKDNFYESISNIGHTAEEMLVFINEIVNNDGQLKCKQLIISGGIRSFLDGYYLINTSKLPAIYGQASSFLKYANESYDVLKAFVESQVEGLNFAYNFLKIRK